MGAINEFFANYHMAVIWFMILVGSLFIEAQTDALVAIWFMPSAAVTLILSFFVKEVWIQILVFVLLSAILLILSKLFFQKFLKRDRNTKTNLDAVIGKQILVDEEVCNLKGTGSAKLNGAYWSLRAIDDETVIPSGTLVTIAGVIGSKLVVEIAPVQNEINKEEASADTAEGK